LRILLTGASGFIGQYVARTLKKNNFEIVTVGRQPAKEEHDHIQVDFLNQCNFSTVVMEARATHLIHLAWYADHQKYWSSPLNMDWIKATVMLIDAFCRYGGEHVVVSGTCAEYDWKSGYCTEDVTPISPQSIYGISKDATRRICQNICAGFEVPLAWGRIFSTYGQGESDTRLLPALAAVFSNKKAAFGVNQEAYRDLLHVADVADALVTLTKSQASGCYNISSGEAILIREFVCLIANYMNVDPSNVLKTISARKGEPKMLIGNNEKLQELGWKQKISLIDGIEDSIKNL
jgi:nucleoside-diphosphate-sugar epimerase